MNTLYPGLVGSSDDMRRSSTYMAMYSDLSFISLNNTHRSALQGLKLSCSMVSSILCAHLKLSFSRYIELCRSDVYVLVVLQTQDQLLCIFFLL